MAFQPVPDVAEYRLVYSRGGDFPVVNVFHCRDTVAPWTSAHLLNTGNDILAWWTANIRPLIATSLTLQTIQYRDLGAEFGQAGEISVSTAGTRVGELMASTACMVVKWTCDAGAAPRRGFTYHGGLVEADGSSDAWLPTPLADVENGYDALRSAVDNSVATTALVIVSRFQNKALRPAGVSNTIADVSARSVMGVQKRRRRNVSTYIT